MTFLSLKKTSSVISYDKSQETDSQMLTRIGKKFVLIFFVLLMSDTLFDWFLGLLDLLFEGIHIVIEAIEYSIELILESLFQTNHQQSELIIVNVTLIISLYLVYRFCLATPKLCSKLYSNLTKKASSYFDRKTAYWLELPLIRKIKLASTYCFGITCILFLVTL